MNRKEAFEHCLDNAVKPLVTKGVWGSFWHRWRKGTLKEGTVLELLQEHGYKIVEEEQWKIPGDIEIDVLAEKLVNKTLTQDDLKGYTPHNEDISKALDGVIVLGETKSVEYLYTPEKGLYTMQEDEKKFNEETKHIFFEGKDICGGFTKHDFSKETVVAPAIFDKEEEEETYFDIATFNREEMRFKLRTVQADTAREAISKVKGKGVDVTGDMQALMRFVNNTIEQSK